MGMSNLVTQPTPVPTTKVKAGLLSGGLTTVAIGVLAALQTVDTSTVWGAVVAYAAAMGAAYFKRARSTDA